MGITKPPGDCSGGNCVTKPQWAHLEYRWTLENFWELRALASIDALEEDSVIWSPRFGDSKRGYWRLKIYPYGDSSAAGKGHVSLFLAFDTQAAAGSPAKTYAIFSCYVIGVNNSKVEGSGRSFTRQKFVEGSASWGWSQFLKADEQGFSGMLVSDTLTLKCDIDVFVGLQSSPAKNLPAQLLLKDELVSYFKNKNSKNVHLKVLNSTVSVNQALLCSRSLTFRSLLAPSTMPSNSNHNSNRSSSRSFPSFVAAASTRDDGDIESTQQSQQLSQHLSQQLSQQLSQKSAPALLCSPTTTTASGDSTDRQSTSPSKLVDRSSSSSATPVEASKQLSVSGGFTTEAKRSAVAVSVKEELAVTTQQQQQQMEKLARLNPRFSSPKEFVVVSIIEDDNEENSKDILYSKTIVLQLTHPDVTPFAVEQMTVFLINDSCEVFSRVSPPITKVLELLIISIVYNVPSLERCCVEHLMSRITAKSDAKLILAVAEKFHCSILVEECHTFFQYFSPELQGQELMRLLLPPTSIGPPSMNETG